MELGPNAQLAFDTILRKPCDGIPSWQFHPMEHAMIDRFAEVEAGSYVKDPYRIYLLMQHKVGTNMIDQYLPTNPLTMGAKGYESGAGASPTTGQKEIVLDGITIDSPEAVVQHIEEVLIPRYRTYFPIEPANREKIINDLITKERNIQQIFGPNMLKVPYGCNAFPILRYYKYGYENYFMAYALYPDVIEKVFKIEADYAVEYNQVIAEAYKRGNLPPLLRLDHDMADGRGTLVDIKSLEKIWFPHFARAIKPLVDAGILCIWHCDGNLMKMIPPLLDSGIKGFQGFQYEYGMDYEKICQMKTRDGEELFIIAGVSVTTTLVTGTPDDIRKEMRWLVEKGPKVGLFLGESSSIAPGVSYENLKAFADGLAYYRKYGRKGL